MCNPNEMIRISGNNEVTEATGQVDNSNYRIRIKYMLEKIEEINPKIHFEVLDPDSNPDKVKNFGTVNIDDIVFVRGDMINSFNVNEILAVDKAGRYVIDGESKFASMINSLGEISTAAHTIANTVESAFYIPGYGMMTAAATLSGNSLGANDQQKMKDFVH